MNSRIFNKENSKCNKKTYFHSYARFNGNENWEENAIFIEIKNHHFFCVIHFTIDKNKGKTNKKKIVWAWLRRSRSQRARANVRSAVKNLSITRFTFAFDLFIAKNGHND